MQLSKYILLTCQWRMLIKVCGYSIGFAKMLHIIMSGKFIESATPGFKIGEEITKQQ